MSSIVTSVLNATFGLLFNKTRDYVADKLKHGDLTDEKFRQLVVRELDDIKTKIDGLVRKDLLASVCFLKEGVYLLIMSLDGGQSNNNQNEQTTSQATQAEAFVNDASLFVLAQCMASLKIGSEDRLLSAKKCFEDARKEATRAFSNEALSLEDRILATKLRVVSRLLESVEDPEAAVSSCMLYLEDLHKMPAVQEIFSVHVNGGIKARFNKTKRLENLKSVNMINVVVFDFTRKFTKLSQDLISWPIIETVKRPCYPILVNSEILNELREFGLDAFVPHEITLKDKDDDYFWPQSPVVNSKGEIITASLRNRGVLNVVNTAGEVKAVCRLPEEGTLAICFHILSLAIDAEDSVYVLTEFPKPQGVENCKIFVYDDKLQIKKQLLLGWPSCNIAVSKEKKIVAIAGKLGDDLVRVLDNDGNLLYSFALDCPSALTSLSISDKNEIIVGTQLMNAVYIYTEEGKMKRSIQLPGVHTVYGVAFHHVTKKVIVHTKRWLKDSYDLLSYSETGELQTLPLLRYLASDYDKLTSHPRGPVALVHLRKVLFI